MLAELCDVGYEYYPKMFVIHCIYFCVMILNGAIADNGISDKYSPREIVLGREIDFKKDCKAQSGLYVKPTKNAGWQTANLTHIGWESLNGHISITAGQITSIF